MEENAKSIPDIMQILRKRRWSLILPTAVVFLTAVAAALLWPPTYRATSTILIEEQEIPREFVAATVTSYAEQRLQNLNQRIMSSTRLLEIVSRFDLYADKREKWTTEEIVEKMRKDIKFQTISADVIDRRTGRPTAATIAFSVSYEGGKADTVLQVANILASLFLEENMKVREQQTAGASRFLEEEGKIVQTTMAALESKIANYRGKNINSLPEMLQANLQTQDRLEHDVTQLNDQLRTLKEKEGYLQSQLASIPMDTSNPDKDRLKELRAKLINLKTRYSDEYPDVIKTKAEIAELERRLGTAVQRSSPGGQPDNPAYIQLSSQLASTRSDIDSVKRQFADTKQKRNAYQQRVAASPQVEEHYKVLLTERTNTQAKYDDLMKKHMEAKVASGMEKGQMGERFTLIDAARLPEKPVKPNIPAILIIGFILGIGGGIGSASLREFADQSARSAEELARATGLPVLAVIPTIVTWQESRRQLHRKIWIYVGVVLAIGVGLALLHFFVMDLDVPWARLMRKLEM